MINWSHLCICNSGFRNHIIIVLSYCKGIEIYKISYVLLKILFWFSREDNNLIKFNCYNLKERDYEKKETINLKFTKQKADHENAIDFRWLDAQGEDKKKLIRLSWLIIFKSKLMKILSLKSNKRIVWLLWYHTKREVIIMNFLEVNSNT